MILGLPNLLRCRPNQISAKCCNCKRWVDHAKQTGIGVTVNVKNSKSKACLYIPISLQEKV
jgi:hypothetical protein